MFTIHTKQYSLFMHFFPDRFLVTFVSYDTLKMTIKASTSAEDNCHLKMTGMTGNGTQAREPTKRKLRQPDSCWSWIVCAAGVTCNIIVIGCTYCFGIIFPSLLDEFKEGKSKTGELRVSVPPPPPG